MESEDDKENLLDKGTTITVCEKDGRAAHDLDGTLDDIQPADGKFSNVLAIIMKYSYGTRKQQCDGSLWGENHVQFVSGFLGNLGIPGSSYYL